MKRIKLFALISLIFVLSGCSTTSNFLTAEKKAKIKALIEKYNTEENRDKLVDAIEKVMNGDD